MLYRVSCPGTRMVSADPVSDGRSISFSTFVIYYLDKDESTKKDVFCVPSECEAEWFFFLNPQFGIRRVAVLF